MNDRPRLIESAFPLKQASIDSVHEKNVRHGHISTLHIWPARRPLAASRAALIATLLPDPGNAEERKRILEKLGGTVVHVPKKKKMPSGKVEEKIAEETVGGILHWGREGSPDLEWFRKAILEANGGRPPKVLDPFAGGGAIPLEAMRLGCEVTAIDINPVAWFILKCTLEYPQKMAGKRRPLPKFAVGSADFMQGYFKGTGKLTKKQMERNLHAAQFGLFPPPDVDLSWHVRAWGWWVLQEARKTLARFYPTYAEFEPISDKVTEWTKRERKLVPLGSDGSLDRKSLLAEFDEEYLNDARNPRWVPKPTVAYLWARTVACKDCRATVPLLKTRWLCKKDDKRVLLTMAPDADKEGVVFGVDTEVPVVGTNSAQRREHDKRIGAGTMSRSGAKCPCCGSMLAMEDIRLEGQAGRLGAVMTAVVVDGKNGKEYRLPTEEEIRMAAEAEKELVTLFGEIPFGLPDDPLPSKEALGFRVPLYGFDRWHKLFTPRQLLALGTFVKHTRAARDEMRKEGYGEEWVEAISGYLALSIDRLADYSSTICLWALGEFVCHTFTRFALPITWDFVEGNPIGNTSGNYEGATDWVSRVLEHLLKGSADAPQPVSSNVSAKQITYELLDVIVTDPPYYDAIPYSDLMDFFYVWLRRTLHGLSPEMDAAFREPLSPKWDHEKNDGELIDDSSRFGGDKDRSKANYEDGMARAFQACHKSLKPEGRFVVVFAHKQPDAWETLVSAIIRAGFVVDGSWPIQTEREARMRAYASAALSSSVWLVCRKRPEEARPGWDNRVLDEMREKIHLRLREFWDAGIRGPDFVWAATGPALEAYSSHPVVKKANAPGQTMNVAEFLRHVRRIVVDFVVGRVLSHNGGGSTVSLDDVTTYYLLHRNDFGLTDTPSGPCILYAVSCGLSDRDLADQYDILVRTGGQAGSGEGDEETEFDETDDAAEEGTGSTLRLKPWNQRKRPGMGYDPAVDSPKARRAAASPPLFPEAERPAVKSREVPLIDQAHRLMHLWMAGDVVKVDEYLDSKGLRRSMLFKQLLQAMIELSPAAGEERSLLESISNHLAARGETFDAGQGKLYGSD